MRVVPIFLFLLVSCAHVAAGEDPILAKRKIIEQITSIFENETPVLQYGYVERLKDSYFRGITFGRSGFVTCMDGPELLELYETDHPNTPLTPFLKVMQDSRDGKITCSRNADLLERMKPSFREVIREMARRSDFREAQDTLEDRLYYSPSVRIGQALGLKLPWSYLNLYDAIIQHGADGVVQIATDTSKSLGGTPATGLDEIGWTTKFIALRRHVLATGDPEWRKSVGRMDALLKIHTRDGNDDLEPFRFDAGEYGVHSLPTR